jgi:tetratricopeptide (TPR) repeat protein
MRGNLKHGNPHVTMKRSLGYVIAALCLCSCLFVQPIYAEFTEEELSNPETLSAEDWFEIGNIFFDNNELSDAVGSWYNAMYLDPELSANAWYNVGLAYAVTGDYAEAVTAWENAVAIKPDSPMAYDNLGTAYAILGMPEKSLNAYDMAVKLDPDEPKYKADRTTLIAALGGETPARETPFNPLVGILSLLSALVCIAYVKK